MTGNKVTIKLTAEQQKQIMDATGVSLTELNMDVASIGRLSEKDLDKVAGGISHVAEVAVVALEFEEGNPDRPIITGSVYNGS